jgi:hypothetical protein
MPKPSKKLEVYLEVGSQRTIAGVLGWPGWCRVARDETSVLQALLDYGPRYAKVIGSARLGFKTPKDVSAFKVAQHIKGNAATDYGVPNIPSAFDKTDMTEADLKHYQAILKACWRAFDKAVDSAKGKKLRKGPRGGGRELGRIFAHVTESEGGYLTRLGLKVKTEGSSSDKVMAQTRKTILDTLALAVREGQPKAGPRGGKIWTPRYLVSRDAWHILDHVWEIEDRLKPQ